MPQQTKAPWITMNPTFTRMKQKMEIIQFDSRLYLDKVANSWEYFRLTENKQN
jgi:hypothetical protein